MYDPERLVGPGSDFWPNDYICVACDAGVTAIMESEADPKTLPKMRLRDLEAHELLAALSGCGLPEEAACSAQVVAQIFATKQVVSVQCRDVPNTGRSLLESLTFADGTKMHLASSTHGAVVYRIRHPFIEEQTE